MTDVNSRFDAIRIKLTFPWFATSLLEYFLKMRTIINSPKRLRWQFPLESNCGAQNPASNMPSSSEGGEMASELGSMRPAKAWTSSRISVKQCGSVESDRGTRAGIAKGRPEAGGRQGCISNSSTQLVSRRCWA